MSVSPAFGPIVGPYSVEVAAVATLQKWFWPSYLEEATKQVGLSAGSIEPPADIYGVFDEDDFINERMPGIMVACTEPSGEPERYASLGTGQLYRLIVMCAVRNDDRDIARRDASLYIAAATDVIMQKLAREFPDLVSDRWLVDSPRLTLPAPDQRLVYLSRSEIDVFVAPILVDTLGPADPVPPGGSPPPGVVVTEVNVDVESEPLDS